MTKRIRVLAITGSRADFGIASSLLHGLRENPKFDLRIVATGGHLVKRLGCTYTEIERAGFDIYAKVKIAPAQDTGQAVAEASGRGMARLAGVIGECQPDVVVLVGDRYETLSAAFAAYLMQVPVAHMHGGELTTGAMDDAIRHAITKLSHIHFVSTKEYGRRVRQMGEEAWRVRVVGAPGLDALRKQGLMSVAELTETLGFDPRSPTVLLTYHPATLSDEPPGPTFDMIAGVLSEFNGHIVITGPNTDPGSGDVLASIDRFVADCECACHIPSLGHKAYMSLMRYARCMVGNSSSGIIEAASFRLPVLNIGERQAGRHHARNVVDVASTQQAVRRGLYKVTSESFRKSLSGLRNPYGQGLAWKKMMAVLEDMPDRRTLLTKDFCDISWKKAQ